MHGSGEDLIRSLTFGPHGEVLLVGKTDSPNFPITPDAEQPALAGDFDAFVARLAIVANGDMDGDEDVDADGLSLFVCCIGGPDVTVPLPRCDPADFARADLDCDGDVDLGDLALFQQHFTSTQP